MATERKFKLDVFKLLEAIDQRNFDFYVNLSNEEKKGFAGIVAMRWMSTVSDKNRDVCEVLSMYSEYCPTASIEELEMLFGMNDIDELIEMATLMGYQPDQIKDIKKSIKEMKK